MRSRLYAGIALVAGIFSACSGGNGNGGNGTPGGAQPLVLVVTSAPTNDILTNVSPFPVFGSTVPGATVRVNTQAVTVDGTGEFSTTVAVTPGPNPVTVIASLGGVQSTVQFTVTLQQTPPPLAVTQPSGTIVTNIAGQPVVGSTAASGARVRVNNVEQTLTNGSFSTNVTLQPGPNLIRVVAQDEAGNETVVERSATLDNVGPSLIVENLSDGATVYFEPLVIFGSVEPEATVTVNGIDAPLVPNPGSLTEFSFSFPGFEPVTNVQIVARDPAGNTTTLTMTINRFAPPKTVYVASANPAAIDIVTCGSVRAPCKTIARGLSRATLLGASRVLVATDVYPESVTLVNGISLFGGFDVFFETRNLSTLRAEILGTGTRSVTAIGITANTQLEGFVVRGPLATSPGANSTGIYIRDSTAALNIQNNVIFSGRAANGAAGASATAGLTGADGQAGQNALVLSGSCLPANLRAGASGGSRTVGADNISGGNGGANANCPTGALSEISGQGGVTGQPGAGVGGGSAGTGGDAGDDSSLSLDGSLSSLVCTVPVNPMEGAAGTNGTNGGNGAAGSGGTLTSVIAHEWVASAGTVGVAAANGGGGGGGGAGGGARCVTGCTGDILGATGGGGGSGGAAGSGGGLGSGGGGVFGVFLSFQNAPTSLPVIINNVIHNGIAGNGGSGGFGGVGGASGKGGSAGTAVSCAGASGKGGDGGDGGHGGGGGGGRGGNSVGVFGNLAGFAAPTYQTDNSILTTAGSAGAGGLGGLTLGNTGGSGTAGSVAAVTYIP